MAARKGPRLYLLLGDLQSWCTWKAARVDFDPLMLLELVMSWQIIHRLCVVISAHLALPMTCWHPWLYVAEAVRLFALG